MTAVYGVQHSMAATTANITDSLNQPQQEEQYISTFFCRALYDYQTKDPSSLSFHKNDIIEVLTRLESGWWDGLLGDERGWFPSNYVAIISDQEAEAALSAAPEFAANQSALPDDSIVDMAHSMSSALSGSDRDVDWLEGEMDYSAVNQRPNGHTSTNGPNGTTQHNDFWVPRVSQDGRIFYVNTQTGQHSRDLPQETEELEGDLVSLSHSARAGPSAVTALTTAEALGQASQDPTSAGFGLPRRTRTPEPWVRRLADDGLSYYYQNTLNGQVSWSPPETDDPPAYTDDHSHNGIPHASTSSSYVPNGPSDRDRIMAPSRLRSDSSVSRTRERTNGASNRLSVCSDDSDVQPLQSRDRSTSTANVAKQSNGSSRVDPQLQTLPDQHASQSLTPAEEVAKSLQKALSPSPPESPTGLSQHVREAVTVVVEYLQSMGHPRRPEQSNEVDNRVFGVVTAVRNLLYVTATPTGHIPTHLYPRGLQDAKVNQTTQALQTHLKASHRKVAGTLSKLVLSALAMQYDPTLSMGDKPNRMESDATELERSVAAFVIEVQKFQEQQASSQQEPDNEVKRLHGVFSTANIGLGLPGAGAAGSWRGFGYTPLDVTAQPPEHVLQAVVVAELKGSVGTFEHQLMSLMSSPTNSWQDAGRLQTEGHSVVAYLSSLLAFVDDINIAQHVDIDGDRSESSQPPNHALYVQTVETARQLLRTLETAVQSLYDDAAALFMTVQSTLTSEQYCTVPEMEKLARVDFLDALVTAIRANLNVVVNTLEALLAIGHDQANVGQATYNNSLEWRRSRMSIVDGNIHLPPSRRTAPQEEDVVDMELAFSRPGMRTMASLDTNGSATLYSNGTPYSETSLDMSDRSRSDGPGEPMTPSWPSQELSDAGTLIGPHSPTLDDTLALDDQSSPLFDDENEGPSSTKSPPRAAKLIKLLGADAPQHYITKLNADAKPWYLRPNYDQSEILIDPDGGVRAGTTAALVERLTAHEHGDPTYIKNFLMTFKSFVPLDELFDLLARRFWIQPPDNLNIAEMEEWTKLKQHVIRMRVLNTFKTLVTDDDLLEKDDMYILDRIKEFASDPEVINFTAAKQLLILIERAQRGDVAPIKTTNTASMAPPPSIIPRSSKKLKLLDIDPLELARQLTLMEATLYKKIRPTECLLRSREQKAGKSADNITSIIQLSNRIANWVAESVLSREDSRKRATVVKHFINVADRCRSIQNFSTMVAIISGLNTPPIRRLKRTWEQVNTRLMQQLGQCESTIDTNKNFNNYRSTLARITPPCVPFIGVYLTTLTFINDGAEDKLAGQMINFRKRQKAAEVIQDIKRWQSKPYNFQTVASVLGYLEESFNKYTDGTDYGDQFWHLSLEREPREREDEKMARLLQESGFL